MDPNISLVKIRMEICRPLGLYQNLKCPLSKSAHHQIANLLLHVSKHFGTLLLAKGSHLPGHCLDSMSQFRHGLYCRDTEETNIFVFSPLVIGEYLLCQPLVSIVSRIIQEISNFVLFFKYFQKAVTKWSALFSFGSSGADLLFRSLQNVTQTYITKYIERVM